MDLKEQASLIDLILRVFCLEKILVEKNLLTKEDLEKNFTEASEKLMRDMLSAVNYTGDFDKAISEFKKNSKLN
jgi:hypothetical protein